MKSNVPISIPVFVSDEINEKNTFPFEGPTYTKNDLINFLRKKGREFKPISKKKRLKNIRIGISNITLHDVVFPDNDPGILVQATAYTFGTDDRYLETTEQIKHLSPKDKVGSDKYFFLIYPHIYGDKNDKVKWVVLIFVDPNKETNSVITVTKLILRKVFNIVPKNIKPKSLTEGLNKSNSGIPKLTILLENEEEGEAPLYFSQDSLIKSVSKKVKKYILQNVPISALQKFYNDKSMLDDFNKRKIDIQIGKRTIKLEEILNEDEQKISETIEEIFNFATEIDTNECPDYYEIECIRNTLEPILKNYLSSYDSDQQ